MPSLYEGFGLPLIEAMACGCPVIASNSSSLPEVAENAALFFAPGDSLELARLVHRLVTEPTIRNELIGKGFDRVTHFSWERTAQATLQVYQRVEAELGFRYLPSIQGQVLEGTAQRTASPSKSQNMKNGSQLVKR